MDGVRVADAVAVAERPGPLDFVVRVEAGAAATGGAGGDRLGETALALFGGLRRRQPQVVGEVSPPPVG
ncbi:hypothetical protein [Actinomadura atramentaria]|uniref:hypothetical protein n=1 Tax=Actinomadura atramentaria TaxID=1990 RepID=UPI00037703EC|nr:hypothetical protein [Actinomadura atramentaria]